MRIAAGDTGRAHEFTAILEETFAAEAVPRVSLTKGVTRHTAEREYVRVERNRQVFRARVYDNENSFG